MKLAFCLFKYFPYGGLQRDFLRIAKTCQERGHDVHVYTMHWEGPHEPSFQTYIIKAKGSQNHTQNYSFAEKVKCHLDANRFDLVIGFNKMPYLDVYYAADICYQARVRQQRNFLYRLLPRYKSMLACERAVFEQGQQTKILLISKLQQPEFVKYYQTESERFHLLPPGIAKDRIAPANAHEIRTRVRAAHRISTDDHLLLMVGSGFRAKGLDRAIIALANLPPKLYARAHLFVIGQDNPTHFIKLAKQLKVIDKVHFLGGRPDVPDFLLAGDLLIHPAYHENTGTVLLEAMVSGLPVITVDVCGYAHYISKAHSGVVLPSPFDQAKFNGTLEKMLLADRLKWQQNGLAFANQSEIYSMPEKVVDYIERVGLKRATVST